MLSCSTCCSLAFDRRLHVHRIRRVGELMILDMHPELRDFRHAYTLIIA